MRIRKITGLELVAVVRKCFVQLQARILSCQEDQANYPTGRIRMMEDSGDYKNKVAEDFM